MRIPLLPLLLCAAACSSLSHEEHKQLASYQHNAKIYFEGGKLEQSLEMVERGLEIDPDDYNLRSMRAGILVRTSRPPSAEEDPNLAKSLTEFERLYDERSVSRQEPHVLLFYAFARQKQGLRLVAQASRAAARVERGDAAAADITDLNRRADEEFMAAQTMLRELVDRGEMLRVCYNHLMQLALALRQDDVDTIGKKFLEVSRKEQEVVKQRLGATTDLRKEALLKSELQELQTEEIAVRTVLASYLHDRQQNEQALQHLNAVLAMDPSRTTELYNRARLLQLLGRHDEANADLRKFLATTTLPPDNPRVIEAAQALSK